MKGFALPIVLILVAVLAITILLFSSFQKLTVNQLQARRLSEARDNLVVKIRNAGSLAASLRNSLGNNPALAACVGGACVVGKTIPLTLSGPQVGSGVIAGPAPNGQLYDIWENPCAGGSPLTCPLSVTSDFTYQCPGGLCGIQVGFTVQKTPGSLYPGIIASQSGPPPAPVPVACIKLTGPTLLGQSTPANCY